MRKGDKVKVSHWAGGFRSLSSIRKASGTWDTFRTEISSRSSAWAWWMWVDGAWHPRAIVGMRRWSILRSDGASSRVHTWR